MEKPQTPWLSDYWPSFSVFCKFSFQMYRVLSPKMPLSMRSLTPEGLRHFEPGLLRHVCVYEGMHAQRHAQETYTHICACSHTCAHVDMYGHSHIHMCTYARTLSMYVRVFFFLQKFISIKKCRTPSALNPASDAEASQRLFRAIAKDCCARMRVSTCSSLGF